MPTERVSIPAPDGHMLSGRFDQPDGAARGTVLFAHCFTCSKNLKAVAALARTLVDDGLAVLRFDFTGLGGSGGAFEDTTFSSNVAELGAVAAWLDDRGAPVDLLVGHSLGGAAVLYAAADLPQVRAIATIGAPFDPGHVRELIADHTHAIREDGEAEVELAGRTFVIREAFLDDLESCDPGSVVGELGRPLLVFHAPLDDTVGIENASRLFAAAKHPKSFVSLDDADHLLSDARDAAYVGRVIAAWADRYLDDGADD